MMRNRFDIQLDILNRELTEMGAMCENAIALSVKALCDGDSRLAADVPEISSAIDRKEREIEAMCMKLLLHQQPVARDLRVISSALKMVTDMERIGDQSADIAEIITTSPICFLNNAEIIHDMAVAVIGMVNSSVDAFVKKDGDAASKVIDYDDVVDACFDKVKASLIEILSLPETDGEGAVDLLMIAKYLERIGDHAANIAKWVLFSITGNKN